MLQIKYYYDFFKRLSFLVIFKKVLNYNYISKILNNPVNLLILFCKNFIILEV